MIEDVAVGTEIRVTTDKWEGAGFGPEKGDIGEVVIADYTQADELAVRLSGGEVYYFKAGEFETLEDAAFQPGDRVRVVSSPDPLVEVGTEGVVMSLDDPRLFMAILFGGQPPADLNIVDFEDGFIGLKNNELELIERVEDAGVNNTAGVGREASEVTPVVPQPGTGSENPDLSGDEPRSDFAVGTRVRVIDNVAAAVEVGDEGNVIDRDDERVSPFAAAFAPDGLVFVLFPGKTDLSGEPLVQVFAPERLERVSDSAADTVAGLDSDPADAPVGTHIILTTDIFKPYVIGDRGVVVKLGAYHVVEMFDGVKLYLDPSEFTVSGAQPEADLAEWERELLADATVTEKELIAVAPEEPTAAPVLTPNEYVAFELNGVSWDGSHDIRILNVGNKDFHLEIAGVTNRVAPKLSADERRQLGQALIESAEIGE